MELFDGFQEQAETPRERDSMPLAIRMRPRDLGEFVGQSHFAGQGKLLWRMIRADRLYSLIFYGPPGTGKTSLAHVIANTTKARFVEVNATTSNVKEIRDITTGAARLKRAGRRTILFIDELHRFNKAQQDVLLPDVEKQTLILIGATTHNPFFAINSPLLSRSQIFELKPLSTEDIELIMKRAISDKERGLGNTKIELTQAACDFLAQISDGDARRALAALAIGVLSSSPKPGEALKFDLQLAQESIQRKALDYDRNEDQHYDVISAFIKSMRGSDPDAALYWLAKMLEAGEDPRFIARRILICAAEDVGNADPTALLIGTAAFEAVEFVGMPEARIPLAQAVTYIACAPKSNASYTALSAALDDVRKGRTLPVPDYLKGAAYKGAKRLGRGEGYKYAHSYEGNWVDQDYIPTTRIYYQPTENGEEVRLKERLDRIRRSRKAGASSEDTNGQAR